MPLIIIDGSEIIDPCRKYVKEIKDEHCYKKLFSFNIGHGRGMNCGIDLAKTKKVLLIDSDVTLKGRCVEEMNDMMVPTIYGVGKVITVNRHGQNDAKGMRYLHPYFALINKDQFNKHPRFVHHGAPLLAPMLDLSRKKISKSILNFSGLDKFVLHKHRGTRDLNPVGFSSKTWDRLY